MTTAVYSHPEVVPTPLRQNVDYSFYFVLMGKFNAWSLLRFSNITEKIFRISFQWYYDRCLISANSLGLVFIPILVLVVLNCMIFRTINKATQRHNAISTHQRRDHSVAMMLILIGTFDHNLNSLEFYLILPTILYLIMFLL